MVAHVAVEEVQSNDATVTYDKMVATVVVSVTKDIESLDSNFSIAYFWSTRVQQYCDYRLLQHRELTNSTSRRLTNFTDSSNSKLGSGGTPTSTPSSLGPLLPEQVTGPV